MKISAILLSGSLALALGLPVIGLAQQDPAQAPTTAPSGEYHHHGGGMMRMMQNLNLTPQQQTQIQQIMQQYRQQHPRGSEPDQASRQALHQQIMKVLTPAQQAQLKQNMQNMRKMHAENGGSEPQPSASPI